MGQYFQAVILDPATEQTTIKAAIHPWDYDNGAKLAEHSWMKNLFVQTVESRFLPGGEFYKHRLAWAGDYADAEPDSGETLYRMAKALQIHPRIGKVPGKYRYILNHSKRVYIDKADIPEYDGWIVHPLPYLTFNGDINSVCIDKESAILSLYIGTWARDIISVEESPAIDYTNLLGNN